MNYMFVLYADPTRRALQTPEDRAKAISEHWAVMDDASSRGVFKGANPLAPASTALTVRAGSGNVTVTDGPFAETKEVLGGYYIIGCKDAAEAEYWGRRLAQIGYTSAVEIRGVAALPSRVEASASSGTPVLSPA